VRHEWLKNRSALLVNQPAEWLRVVRDFSSGSCLQGAICLTRQDEILGEFASGGSGLAGILQTRMQQSGEMWFSRAVLAALSEESTSAQRPVTAAPGQCCV